MLRRTLLATALAAPLIAWAQAPAPAAPNPLAPIAHWVGGEWIGEFAGPNGTKIKLIRTYEWGFDKRLIIGRSYGEVNGQRRQSRETHFFWNPQSQRIEFLDHLDQGGGHGRGVIEVKDGLITMDVSIVGNTGHPAWRAWIKETGADQELRVEALRDGKWGPFGTYAYKHVR